MKAFVASCVVLFILAAAVATSGVLVSRTAKGIAGMADALPPPGAVPTGDDADAIEKIRDRWESDKKWIGLSVSRAATEKVDAALSSLLGAAEAGDAGAYAVFLLRLKDAVLSLRG